jgi:formylmethanofuran dehydrogenase subunit B
MSTARRFVPHATCLGCGCACDDIELVIANNRIDAARAACPMGAAWFGDGWAPSRAIVRGREASRDEALASAASLLAAAAAPLVYLAPDISCEAQRYGVACADALTASLDSVSSATVLDSVLAAQERGRAAATLGEVRNRADLLVFWGVDPNQRYPRYWSRYAPEPPGVHVPNGRRSRMVVAVDVGAARGPQDADRRIAVADADEVAALLRLTACFSTSFADVAPAGGEGVSTAADATPLTIPELAALMASSRYAVVVCDTEPDDQLPARDRYRAHALNAMVLALNARTRAALSALRAGGNRSGADAVMTSQSGFPLAVDFSRGFPRYRPHERSAQTLLERGEADAVLLIGSATLVPSAVTSAIGGVETVVVGPRASDRAIDALIAIDTGVAGIHEEGTVMRMDDLPLPVRGILDGPPATAAIVRSLCERIVTVRRDALAGRGSIA